MARLRHDFFDGDTLAIARMLLGKYLVRNRDGTLLAGSAGSGIYALAQDGPITKFSYEQGLEDGKTASEELPLWIFHSRISPP